MNQILILSQNFCAAHFYHQKAWSQEQNQAVFGKCDTPYGHGHNYRLEVGFLAPQQPLAELQKDLRAVVTPLDHQHLNFVVDEFKVHIPTTENIAQYLLKKLHERCPKEAISYIKLFETEDIWVEIRS